MSRGSRKKTLKDKYKMTCFYCDEVIDKDNCTIDHFLPLSMDGKNNMKNMVLSCLACNQLKGSLPPIFFIKHRELIQQSIIHEKKFFSKFTVTLDAFKKHKKNTCTE